MNCPMELPIYDGGQVCSSLKVEREGLYYHFSCRCELPKGQMRRVYAINGLQIVPLGLLMPDGDGYTLRETVSVRSFPMEDITTAVLGSSPEPDLLPWRGEIDGAAVERSWLRKERNGYTLCIPREEPFPLPADLSQAKPKTCGTVECLCLSLDSEGMPVHTET